MQKYKKKFTFQLYYTHRFYAFTRHFFVLIRSDGKKTLISLRAVFKYYREGSETEFQVNRRRIVTEGKIPEIYAHIS